jgi:hypothetical protein
MLPAALTADALTPDVESRVMMLEFALGAVGYRADEESGRVTAPGIAPTAKCPLHHPPHTVFFK